MLKSSVVTLVSMLSDRSTFAKNNPDSKFNSFKVSVNVVDAEKFNNPDVWPVGVCVRRWRSFDKQT